MVGKVLNFFISFQSKELQWAARRAAISVGGGTLWVKQIKLQIEEKVVIWLPADNMATTNKSMYIQCRV
jgi:hypothetical protein